jgi:hypothetical protein
MGRGLRNRNSVLKEAWLLRMYNDANSKIGWLAGTKAAKPYVV